MILHRFTDSIVPVLLLIQMRLSKQTDDTFPTATVNGTCHCKLQRRRVMLEMVSGIGPPFIASVIPGRSIRKRAMVSADYSASVSWKWSK